MKRGYFLIKTILVLLITAAFFTTGVICINAVESGNSAETSSEASTPTPVTSVKVEVNYINQTLLVTKGSQNSTKFYFSQDKMKTWELIENASGLMDLSIFMKTSDNTIYFKGDKDEQIVELTIPKEDSSLKIKYYVEDGKGKLQFTNAYGSMQWRKGTDGNWNAYITDLDLSSYEINGYTLQFRMMASVDKRAGKIVSVKIPKRQNAPSIKVDYSKFIITGLKSGVTEYRINSNGNFTLFELQDSKVKYLDLQKLLLPKDTLQNIKPIPAATIEFRTASTDDKVGSGIRVLEIAEQPLAPSAANVKLDGTTLTFLDASKDKPYEYLTLHTNEEFELVTAKWKKIANDKPISIKKIGTASPVPGDKIYYRLASTTDKETKIVTPASMYSSVTITSIVLPQ